MGSPVSTRPPSWLPPQFDFALKAREVFLSPENDTIGILVSTAVEITVGGKTIKPAGGLWGRGGHLDVGHVQ